MPAHPNEWTRHRPYRPRPGRAGPGTVGMNRNHRHCSTVLRIQLIRPCAYNNHEILTNGNTAAAAMQWSVNTDASQHAMCLSTCIYLYVHHVNFDIFHVKLYSHQLDRCYAVRSVEASIHTCFNSSCTQLHAVIVVTSSFCPEANTLIRASFNRPCILLRSVTRRRKTRRVFSTDLSKNLFLVRLRVVQLSSDSSSVTN